MLKFSPTTPIKFFAKNSAYRLGEGQISEWENLGILYAEWRGSFGERATAAQALGVNDSATVRTFYHPQIYEKLRSVQIVVSKDMSVDTPNKNNPSNYELWGGVDNVGEANRFMEFRVRRYEGK